MRGERAVWLLDSRQLRQVHKVKVQISNIMMID